ncbi:NrfD/PsrC family molybdoenzyme membrane anchor subunit [Allonocardiopsis opalescens]|uniref:Polysulfide reductase NrfD n=1 Tax=Allonocardiopsis opalescens TaxID=1144618 RepID=A0A2T0QCP1_9ACTN|nr:NrfD/PsrC family molybdoenzyme membrane anchor subunit [Allonocardiopsis opalescens]PRY01640.1 polysulfide reductase NrfD [Allonocardiopsis opalescens]
MTTAPPTARTGAQPRDRDTADVSGSRSYYGRPILKEPTWLVPDVPGYLFLGGMAGASASLAALADLEGRPELAARGRYAAAGGALASVGLLIHDLGRPERFLHMLRVIKPTSPLSVGTWILGPFTALSCAAAASDATGIWRPAGRLAGLAAGLLGPAMSTYTAALLTDTAVPAWHEARAELPFVFAGSALTSGAGAALLLNPPERAAPARRLALIGAGLELGATRLVTRRLGLVGEPYRTGRPGRLLRTAEVLTAGAAGLLAVAGRRRWAAAAAGAALLAAGACTRFGVFEAGRVSARDPKYVVAPQRARLAARAEAARREADGAAPGAAGAPAGPG